MWTVFDFSNYTTDFHKHHDDFAYLNDALLYLLISWGSSIKTQGTGVKEVFAVMISRQRGLDVKSAVVDITVGAVIGVPLEFPVLQITKRIC